MLDYLDDLESDFSAIHRVDDIQAMDGPRFFRMAWRISTYQGVMRLQAEQQAAHEEQRVTWSPAPSARASSGYPLAAVFSPEAGVTNWTPSGDWTQVS